MKVKGQLEQAQLENKSADPSNLPEGLLWLNTTQSKAKAFVGGSSRALVTEDQAQTITNKNVIWAYGSTEEVVDSAAGSDLTLTQPTKSMIRLTGAVTSLAGIGAVADRRYVVLLNATGSTIVIKNDQVATASDRILTGSGNNISLKPNASLWLIYDVTSSKWRVIGGSGSGGGYVTRSTVTLSEGDFIPTTTDLRQLFVVEGNAAAVTASLTPFGTTGGWDDGTEIVLIGNSDTNTVSILANDAAKGVVGNFTACELVKYSVFKCIYLSAVDRWVFEGIA